MAIDCVAADMKARGDLVDCQAFSRPAQDIPLTCRKVRRRQRRGTVSQENCLSESACSYQLKDLSMPMRQFKSLAGQRQTNHKAFKGGERNRQTLAKPELARL